LVFVLGVYGGLADKFPLGALMNKGLTVRGAEMHGQRYIPMLLDRIDAGDLDPRHLVTHEMTLDEAPRGYQMFKDRRMAASALSSGRTPDHRLARRKRGNRVALARCSTTR
jgi:threonine dehydrogenase-like Zn-dependent dehydrogenase